MRITIGENTVWDCFILESSPHHLPGLLGQDEPLATSKNRFPITGSSLCDVSHNQSEDARLDQIKLRLGGLMPVWDCYIQKGNPRPNDTFASYLCKVCGQEIPVQMAGSQSILERSFEDQALFKLADHLADHIYCEGKPTRLYITSKIREKIAWKKFVREAVEVKVCPQCGSDLKVESEPLSHERGSYLILRCKNADCGFEIKPADA